MYVLDIGYDAELYNDDTETQVHGILSVKGSLQGCGIGFGIRDIQYVYATEADALAATNALVTSTFQYKYCAVTKED